MRRGDNPGQSGANPLLPFAIRIDHPPVSQQARSKKLRGEWIETVRRNAAQYWPAQEMPSDSRLMVTIVHFYTGIELDVDNIPKPILDGIKGLVYSDDRQITDLVCRKRELEENLPISELPTLLQEGINRGYPFVYIMVTAAPDPEVIH